MFKKMAKIMTNKKVRIIGTTVLTGVGLYLTVRQAIKETPKVNYILEESKEQELSKAETAKVVLKNRWKSIALGVSTLLFVVAVVCSEEKDISKISSAYAVSEASITSFRKAVDEVVTPEVKKEINKKYVENQAENHSNTQTVYITDSNSKILFRETFSGETFYSTLQEVQDAVSEINRQVTTSGFDYATLGDLMDEIGKKKYGQICDIMGWNISDGKIKYTLEESSDGEGHLCWGIILDPTPQCIL